MSNPRVLCLGEILVDCLADQIGVPLEQVTSWTSFPGGAPANVACALTKLGTSAAFIGAVGTDPVGEELVQLCQDLGVNCQGIQRSSSLPTRQVYVLRSSTGDRTFAGFGSNEPDAFADTQLSGADLPIALFKEAEVLILGTLELAYPQSQAAVFRALQLAEEYHLKVVLDVNWRPMFWKEPEQAIPLIQKVWPFVDFVKLSAEEAQWLFDTTDAGVITYRLDSVEGVLVTDGPKIVRYCLSENEGTFQPFSVAAQDTTGAGDAFLAGFVHQLSQKGISSLQNPKTVKSIIAYASAVGALTATKPGAIAAQPTPLEVETFLKNNLAQN